VLADIVLIGDLVLKYHHGFLASLIADKYGTIQWGFKTSSAAVADAFLKHLKFESWRSPTLEINMTDSGMRTHNFGVLFKLVAEKSKLFSKLDLSEALSGPRIVEYVWEKDSEALWKFKTLEWLHKCGFDDEDRKLKYSVHSSQPDVAVMV
jgi:hypothetical protein